MALHDETARRIRELFADKKCRRCGQPAQRYWRQRYFCRRCFPAGRPLPVHVHRAADPPER
jgi:hypothetical protein